MPLPLPLPTATRATATGRWHRCTAAFSTPRRARHEEAKPGWRIDRGPDTIQRALVGERHPSHQAHDGCR